MGNITLLVADTLGHRFSTIKTDAQGAGQMFLLWGNECDQLRFLVSPVLPTGFELTTTARLVVTNGDTLAFGFVGAVPN